MEIGKSREELVSDEGTRPRGVWARRTGLEKVLVGVSGVALVACVAMVGVLATGSTAPAPQSSPAAAPVHPKEPSPPTSSRLPVYQVRTKSGGEYEICSTPECTLAAADIILAMDTNIDPCQDFYQFACGNWIKNNPVPDASSKWSQFNLLDVELMNALSLILTEPINEQDPEPINKAKYFSTACLDEVTLEIIGVSPLSDFLSQFGGWPMTIGGWTEADFDWQVSVSEGRKQVGTDYLINVWVFADEKDTYSTTIYIDQTSLGMPRSVLTAPENYVERIEAYKTYMTTTASIIATSLGEDTSQIDSDVSDVLDFEIALANLTTPAEDRRNIDRMYNNMTVTELSELTTGSNIDWLQLLNNMFSGAGISIDENTRVIVQEKEYMQKMSALVLATSQRTVSNYLMWRHVKALGDETNGVMREASFQYNMVASGISAQRPREQLCSDKSNNYLGQAIGTKYVQSYFSQQAKDEVNDMVEDLRSSFKDLLDVNVWMDDETKPLAVEKADAISKSIGYPDWYGNDTALLSYYSGLGDIKNDTHFQNVLNAKNWMSTDELDDFGKPTERDRWYMVPAYVNAYYMPEFNSINFPAGILQSPFYRANTLQALNYGGIGQVIGHEITHGFDDQGRQNDKEGNAIPWWTNATLEAFNERAKCIVNQYDTIRLPEIDHLLPNATLNGVNTQGENIADNGGLREALLAYLKFVNRTGEEPRLPGLEDYTPMQLFFLNNANIWCTSITDEGLLNQVLTDPHSPGEYRVKVPMTNMKEFSTIWGCAADTPMNPTDKCVVW